MPSNAKKKKVKQSNNNFLKIIFFIEICKFWQYIAFYSLGLYLKFMTVQINYKSSNLKKISSNLVLFVDEKFNIGGLKKHISNSELSYISDLLKNSDLKKNLLVFEVNSKKHLVKIF